MRRRQEHRSKSRFAQTEDLYGLQPQSKKRWRQILKMLGERCLKCGAVPVTKDHIVPLCRGGLHHPTNLQSLCYDCNVGKNDAIADYRTPQQREAILARWPLERVPLEGYSAPIKTTMSDLIG